MNDRLTRTIAQLLVLSVLGVAAARADTVLITGANSGIGLEFAKQYAAKGWTVIATHRRDETPDTLRELMQSYPSVRAERMDVTSYGRSMRSRRSSRARRSTYCSTTQGCSC